MRGRITRWYYGASEQDPETGNITTTVHWSARAARPLISFYLRYWQWLWTVAIGIALAVFKLG